MVFHKLKTLFSLGFRALRLTKKEATILAPALDRQRAKQVGFSALREAKSEGFKIGKFFLGETKKEFKKASAAAKSVLRKPAKKSSKKRRK